ncbi:MAG: Asp23/Gls24 family envelope stress response protein [Chlamydiales bacterium]|nr:Asp23/Gls24 family envelope stress response protein [Chlamydiales bacterium]
MQELKKKHELPKVDTKEFELPETVFIRDIETRVFQAIVLQCLAKIKDISLTEGNFIDNILGRNRVEGVKGIYAEQDSKTHSVKIRVEVNVAYGVTLPEKADEIQEKVSEEVTKLTGLHVACVHVVFKNLIPHGHIETGAQMKGMADRPPLMAPGMESEEYSDEFK